jgi:hypothetical protein
MEKGIKNGAEHFQVMSTATNNSPNSPLIAWGVFTGAGVDRQISSNAAGTKGVDAFIFANGKFTVKHTAKTQKQSFNTKTCFYAFSEFQRVHSRGVVNWVRRLRGVAVARVSRRWRC